MTLKAIKGEDLGRKPRRWCYTILADQFDENGYIPSAVYEGQPGHRPLRGRDESQMPWYWGKTYAEASRVCDAANERMGISPKEALDIVISSQQALGAVSPEEDA